MATIQNLEVSQVEQHLLNGNMLGAFTDIYGDSQPAPTTQLNELRLSDAKKNERFVMIRTLGGNPTPTNSTFFNSRNMVIVIVSRTGEDDSIIANGLAEDIAKYILDNSRDNECLFNISSSGVTGPFIMPEGRRAYEINFSAMFNIVRPVFS